MKNKLNAFAVCLFFVLSSVSGFTKGRNNKVPQMIDVNNAFKAVYDATQQALAEGGTGALSLTGIDLAFSTTTTYSVEGGIKLWVVSGKYSKSFSTAQKATFSFAKAEPSRFLKKSINEQFINYVVSVIKAAETIKPIDNFGLDEIEVEVEFTVSKSAEGGVEIELSPVTPTLGGSRDKEIVHTIILKLKRR